MPYEIYETGLARLIHEHAQEGFGIRIFRDDSHFVHIEMFDDYGGRVSKPMDKASNNWISEAIGELYNELVEK